MRIVYLHQYFTTPAQAGGSRSYEMGRRLVAKGHEVHMVTSDRTPGAPAGWARREVAGMHVHSLGVPYDNTMGLSQRLKAFGEFAGRAAHKGARLPADVVFATSTPLTIALPGVYAARRHRAPMVFEVRDLWPEVPIALGALPHPGMKTAARALEQFAYRNAAEIVALSDGMKAGVVRAGYPAERVTVIPNGCDLDVFDVPDEDVAAFRRRHEWLGDRPYLLYAGAFGTVNGVGYAVRLADAVRRIDPEFRILLVGAGKEEEAIRTAARARGVLDETLFMLPRVPKHELAVAMAGAAVSTSFVIDVPELFNNSANKFFDSLAAGVAVAVNHGGWQAELLESSGAGFVLDPHDLDRAAQTLVDRVRDADWLAQAGRAARGLAEERFARDLLADQLEDVLLRAAG